MSRNRDSWIISNHVNTNKMHYVIKLPRYPLVSKIEKDTKVSPEALFLLFIFVHIDGLKILICKVEQIIE